MLTGVMHNSRSVQKKHIEVCGAPNSFI